MSMSHTLDGLGIMVVTSLYWELLCMNLETFKKKVICLIQKLSLGITIIVTTVQEISLPLLDKVSSVKFLHFVFNLFISQKML